MNKALTDTELDHLLNFVGYGSLNASVWFAGMEEAGGGEDNIRSRLNFRQVEDCAEAHKTLGITKHHFGKKTIQRTWRGMCYVMLRLEGKEPDTESIRNYQADYLGRFHGSSLLCELMPIPKPNISSWGSELRGNTYACKTVPICQYAHRPAAVGERQKCVGHPRLVGIE